MPMTGADKKLSEGAIPLSTVPAALVAGNLEAAQAYGLDARSLAAKVGVHDTDLKDPDARIPLERYVALWESISASPRGEDFGFWLGRAMNVRMLGVVGYAMQHAADVRACFRCLDRFRRLVNDVISPVIEETRAGVVFRRTEPLRIAAIAPLAVAAPVGTLTLLHQLTGVPDDEPLALAAAFQHPPPPNAARYEEVLRCPVEFNARELRLVLKREVFDLPLRRPDPALFAYLERHARALEARLPDAHDLRARVRQLVLDDIREGEPQQGAVARRLGLSERTLQRRLRDEETTFAAVVADLRLELARMYLADASLAVFEVAFLLGYSEPSAFNRAFRRWTGRSPSDYRRRPLA
jgi:AraC-like DNA-binding protein